MLTKKIYYLQFNKAFDSRVNRMILFPSWLSHFVPINYSKSDRISIAFNAMLKGKVGKSEEFSISKFLMTNTRYLIIDKKDDVYLKIEADEDIRRELGQFFTFEVPGFKFMLNLEIVYGTER